MKNTALVAAILLDETGLFQQIFGKSPYYSFKNTKQPFNKVKTMGEFIYLLSTGVNNPAEFYKNNLKGDIDTYKEIKALEMAFDSGEATNLIEARTVAHNMYVTSPMSLQSQIIPEVIKTAAQELLTGKYPKGLGELQVNGNDLTALGLKGKEIGDALRMMLLKIYAGKVENNKENLLSLLPAKKEDIKEFSYDTTEIGAPSVWNINGEQVGISFFVKKYDEWNNQDGGIGYADPSETSVLEFLQNNYEDFTHDEKLKRELLWALTDRDILSETDNKEMIDVNGKQISLNYIRQNWNNADVKYTGNDFYKKIYNNALLQKKLTPKQWWYLDFLFKYGKSPYEAGVLPKNI